MIGQCVVAIGFEERDEVAAFLLGEAGADADVLELAGGVVEAEEEGADGGVEAVLVPAKAGDDAVAVALMLDLEHGAFAGLVGGGEGFGHDAI